MKPIPVIIDTDPGIDDAVAIALALFSEELDVKLITTVAGNVGIDYTTLNALRLVTYFRVDVPVARGASEPLLRPLEDASAIHGKTGMEGFEFPEPNESLLSSLNAVDAMRKLILDSEEKITLIPIGPLTNIALLLKTYPEVKANIDRIVMMGGSASRGNKGVMSEFNIGVDPEAAKIVFHAGVPIVMAGLDVGLKALVYPEDSVQLPAMGKTGTMIHDLFKRYRGGSFNTGLKMYDPCAVACLLAPELFTFADTYVDVEVCGELTSGCTVVDLKGYLHQDSNASVAIDVDGEAFRKWFLDGIRRCV
ncbi:ribonucleoside hydrolase RihC [Bifidobacterium phasiani]|uniref:Ribonucleoside hydrolase RihC n=1 Tax=Bifidobacterium phasiani TaxID=2834431 RepID=A0ABS6W9B2_9BIFI|nr:ribonucleoside hydrolase RihC [Bifidobacterium phasiani]MBW3083093.1 ribonucleoside hydrolase RihC [Bifidobacterium phasiani]